LLRECVDFLAPHLAAAKLTGEVRKDLDIQCAGEWFARILFSLFSTPSSALDMDNPDVVEDFVRAHLSEVSPATAPGRGEQSTRGDVMRAMARWHQDQGPMALPLRAGPENP
jgi:hypothetical protein